MSLEHWLFSEHFIFRFFCTAPLNQLLCYGALSIVVVLVLVLLLLLLLCKNSKLLTLPDEVRRFSRTRPAVLQTLSLAAGDAGTQITCFTIEYSLGRMDSVSIQNCVTSVSLATFMLTYRKSSNRSRDLNRRRASNTGLGSERIVLTEAWPRIVVEPRIVAGVLVHTLGGPLPVTELHVRRVVRYFDMASSSDETGKKCCNVDILIEDGPLCPASNKSRGPSRLY